MKKIENPRTFTRRVVILGGIKAAMLSVLAGRMYYLQVVEADKYALLAEENRINLRLLPPLRGPILDRWGTPIASNDQNWRVLVVAEQTPDLKATLADLAKIVPLTPEDIDRVLRESKRKRAFVPILVSDNLTWDQVSLIEFNGPDLPGIAIDSEQRKVYPYAAATAHILGYVSAVSEAEQTEDPLLKLPGFRIGKNGFERFYDAELRGKAGSSHVEVNAGGRVIRELSREEGEPGLELTTTLDIALQNYVQQRLAAELSASAVVLDVNTGDVLALGSTPTFDPGGFSRGLTSREWQDLIADPLKPLSNKAIAGQYAPGSTFKMMVALAALEAGISPDAGVHCSGHVALGRSRFHCWRKGGHGSMNMINGLKQSCDVYFYETARRVGIDKIAAMARRFGLGSPTGLDLPGEKNGLIPDSEWKKATIGERWHPGETLVAGIGQGFITTTPLQLAVMAARIANGKKLIPRLLRAYAPQPRRGEQKTSLATAVTPPAFESLGIEPRYLKLIRHAMDLVVNDKRGTAYRVKIEDPAMAMGGKTGTSQVRRITLSERNAGVKKNEDLPYQQRDHALFVAFAPVLEPRYAAAVVVEHGGGGSAIAGPIAKDIMEETQRRDPARAPLGREIAELPQ